LDGSAEDDYCCPRNLDGPTEGDRWGRRRGEAGWARDEAVELDHGPPGSATQLETLWLIQRELSFRI